MVMSDTHEPKSHPHSGLTYVFKGQPIRRKLAKRERSLGEKKIKQHNLVELRGCTKAQYMINKDSFEL